MAETIAPTPWRTVVLTLVALTLGVSVVVLAFIWPAVASAPQNIPISITGTGEQLAVVTKQIDTASEGRLVLQGADSRADAVDLITQRETLGAIVLGEKPEVLVTSAASPVVSQLLTGLAAQLQAGVNAAAQAQAAAAGVEAPVIVVAVTDVVPLAATDERGAGLAASAFPLVIAGFLGGLLIALLVRGRSRRFVAVVAYSVLVGTALTLILQSWLGILQGGLGLNLLAVSLLVASMVSIIVGMHATLGRPGLPVAIVTIMLIANPISAATQPLQFLPEPWGAIGQLFPPGAGLTLLRDLSYFPEANSLGLSWLVLAIWAAVGLGLTALGLRARRGALAEAALDPSEDAAAIA